MDFSTPFSIIEMLKTPYKDTTSSKSYERTTKKKLMFDYDDHTRQELKTLL